MMPQDIAETLERLRHNDDHLYRVVLGDSASQQPGLMQQLNEIKANTQQIQKTVQWLWVAYGLLLGMLAMVLLQLMWQGGRY